MLLYAFVACAVCGQTTFANTGIELVVEGESTSLDASGGEICGPSFGSWGHTFEPSLSAWPQGRELLLILEPDVPDLLWPWQIDLSMPWDLVRVGESVSLEDATLTGTPCYLRESGCEAGLAMTQGEITFTDFRLDDDPCDPQATISLDMAWELEFGEVGGSEYWVSSHGSDEVPVFIDFLCGAPQ